VAVETPLAIAHKGILRRNLPSGITLLQDRCNRNIICALSNVRSSGTRLKRLSRLHPAAISASRTLFPILRCA
jgi:hypothetical protein